VGRERYQWTDRQRNEEGGRARKHTGRRLNEAVIKKNSITCYVPVMLRAVHYLLGSYSFLVSVLYNQSAYLIQPVHML
jgi:hypothetical protein